MARARSRLLLLLAIGLLDRQYLLNRRTPDAPDEVPAFVAFRRAGRTGFVPRSAVGDVDFEKKREDLKECLAREYRSFFRPFEEEFYDEDVSFVDPLNNLKGKASYKSNVEMLSGESFVGNVLFSDGFIDLHGVEEVPGEPTKLRTRWTLGFVFQLLPWKPRAIFSGVSEYTIDAKTAKVLSQRDYWDNLSLQKGGRYVPEPPLSGLKDLVLQLLPSALKPAEARELTEAASARWDLLRRAAAYRVYRKEGTAFAVAAPNYARGLAGVRAELEAHGLKAGDLRQVDGVQSLELVEPHPWVELDPVLQAA
mmetsp:Transcript_16061/g.38019  ORF Transcript_16061/g.38019 Transcript_16061/m.38019 type:complete len:309 (-) Transcript_16061:254-1180(-)